MQQFKTLYEIVDYWNINNPEEVAFIYDYKRYTYSEFKVFIDKTILQLYEVTKKDKDKDKRVLGLIDSNTPQGIGAMIAAMELGFAVISLPVEREARDSIILSIKEKFVGYIVDSNLCEEIQVFHKVNKDKLIFSSDLIKLEVMDEIVFNKAMIEKANVNSYLDELYYNVTSSSTGKAKIAPTTQQQIIMNAISVNKFINVEGKCFASLFPPDLHPHEAFVRTMVAGKTAFLFNIRRYSEFIKMLREKKINQILAVPSYYELLIKNESKDVLSSIEVPMVGGEAVSYQLREKYNNITNNKLIPIWGSTETSGIVFITPDKERLSKDNVIGVPVGCYIYKISNNGELLIKGEPCIKGYYNNLERECDAEGFYSTGDLVYERDGVLFSSGRSDDQVNVRGRLLNLADLKKKLQEESNEQIMVVHCSDFIGLIVESNGGVSSSILEKAKVYLHSIPYRVITMEHFPILKSGKYDRVKLRKWFDEYLQKESN